MYWNALLVYMLRWYFIYVQVWVCVKKPEWFGDTCCRLVSNFCWRMPLSTSALIPFWHWAAHIYTRMVFPRIACRHFATNATPSSTAVIPKLGRHVSRIGFGAYRIAPGEPRHAQALRDALKAGVSIIDTASNFANGNSPCCVIRGENRWPWFQLLCRWIRTSHWWNAWGYGPTRTTWSTGKLLMWWWWWWMVW